MNNVTTTPRPETGADKLKSAASQAGQAAKDTAQAAGQKAQDLAHTAGQKASEFAQAAGHKVQDAATAVGHKAEDATTAVGSGLQTAADKVRQKLPHEGVLGKASEAVADALDRSGHYIQDKNIRGMAEDVTEVIKRNPIPAVFIAVGLGYLLGRTLRS
jgi:ElaB/YqjD/DUF883 family membrane-anchored ribosome-binding protein